MKMLVVVVQIVSRVLEMLEGIGESELARAASGIHYPLMLPWC